MNKKTCTAAAVAVLVAASIASAQIRISEYMYDSNIGEFIELTNVGPTPIDMSTYSYDDSDRVPGTTSLAAFGIVDPRETVILAEADPDPFRTQWGLAVPGVKVIGGNTNNLGRSDEINIYDGATLVDRLTYSDQNIAGTIRTQGRSGNPSSLAVLDDDTIAPGSWVLSSAGDSYHSFTATTVNPPTANPGVFTLVPEPGSALVVGAMLAVGGMVGGRYSRRAARK